MNPTIQQGVKIATIAGSAALVLTSAMSLLKVSDAKSAIMPIVSILVGVAAFNYAMQSKPAEKKA